MKTIVPKRRTPVEAPPDRPRAVPASPLPPLPLGAPARATAVLTDLRAADSGLGMRRPSAPGPRLSQRTFALRSLDRLVATVAVYDHVADEIDAALAELAALAPLTAKAVAL